MDGLQETCGGGHTLRLWWSLQGVCLRLSHQTVHLKQAQLVMGQSDSSEAGFCCFLRRTI